MPLRLLVIAGPTACGKTRLGVEVAHRLGSEILSADSRQVYRGLDIGTGKDLDEYRSVGPPVPYHLIDIADPRTIYSLYHYQRDCYRVLAAKHEDPRYANGVPLVLVGGTGLYIEAVLKAYRIANVPEDVELRLRLMRRDHAALVEELRLADAQLHRRTDLASKKRVVRSLEVAQAGRDRTVDYSAAPPVPFEYAVFAVDLPRDELRRRIAARLQSRMGQGMVAEVQGLLDAGVPAARLELLGLEYREIAAFLGGAKSEQQMLHDLESAIRRLSKRQRTWFRGLPRRGIPVSWIDAEDRAALFAHPWIREATPPRRA